MYEFVKFLHVAAAIVWVGGGTWAYILLRRLKSAGGPALGGVQQQMAWFGKAVFMPASIVALFSGLYLVVAGGYAPEQWWIVAGLVGIIASIAMGMAVITPTGNKLAASMAEHGPGGPDAAKLHRRMEAATTFNLVVLWAVVVAMVLGATEG